MGFPINTAGKVYEVSTPAVRQLFEFQNQKDRDAGRPKEPKKDGDGRPLYAVSVYLPGARMVVQVRVAGKPDERIVPEMQVQIEGLTINPYRMERGERTFEGVTYRAEKITPAVAAASAKAS